MDEKYVEYTYIVKIKDVDNPSHPFDLCSAIERELGAKSSYTAKVLSVVLDNACNVCHLSEEEGTSLLKAMSPPGSVMREDVKSRFGIDLDEEQ